VADIEYHTIRKITGAGVVTTLAGMAGNDGSEDGKGSVARFYLPGGVAVDGGGNVYVADTGNHTIRKITSSGMVTTLAGLAGNFGSEDGAGSAARFSNPGGVAVDGSGNVYVADAGNHTIRKITSSGVVTTLAGMAGSSDSVDGIRSAARFSGPSGVAVDGGGRVYVMDSSNCTIRKITSDGVVTTLAGMAGNYGSEDGAGSAARFSYSYGLAVDGSGNVYVADTENHTIRKITSSGVVATFAGLAGNYGSEDGARSDARFYYPFGAAVDGSGNVYVADRDNRSIRKITSSGVVTTLAGAVESPGSVDGVGSAARFSGPSGVAVDGSGNVYVADAGNYTIRKITSSGIVTTLAGLAGSSGSQDGAGGAARFSWPNGVAVDGSGNVYVADANSSTIRKITSSGVVTTLAGLAGSSGSEDGAGGAARFSWPNGVAVDGSGNVYVADAGNHTIRKITSSGVVTTLAGMAWNNGSEDGAGSAARFKNPSGVAVDGSGNVYVADAENHTIRKITSDGVVTTLAGMAGNIGSEDGAGSAARFNTPFGMAVDGDGNVYVAEHNNHTIRKITVDGVVTTIGGTAGIVGGSNAWGSAASFTNPYGIAATSAGIIYVAEYQNNSITQGVIDQAPVVTISPGSATVNPGGMAAFTAHVVSGIAPFTYRWRRNGTPISGATGSSYTISSLQQSHEGSYDCVVTNALGSGTTASAFLTVNDPVVIVTPPLSQAANVGQEVRLNVSATGTEPMEFQWRKNGIQIPGENASALVLVVDANSGGFYDVVVTNPLGSVTSAAAALTVLVPPVITAQPSDQNVSAGTPAFFSVTASGSGLTYQWRRNGADLSKQTGPQLMVSNVQKANEGVYDVLVKNAFGAVLSDPAVLSLPQPLGISEHPQDVTSVPGDTATFSVTAVGQGTLTYQWNKDGKPIKDARSSTLNVPVTDPSAAGAYTVTVSSGSLKVTSLPAFLRVTEEGLLIYKFTLTGNSYEGTTSSKIALSGLLVLDRLNQRGGIIRFGKNGKLDTFVTKVDDGIRTDSTGPVTNSQTVVSKVVKAEDTPAQETTMIWLRGTDGLVTFTSTDKTIAPKTLAGFQTEVSLAGYTEVTYLTLVATLDNIASLQARQAGETLEQTLNRLAAGLQQKGFIRE
jgi:sugar lactone lactonase YvrE